MSSKSGGGARTKTGKIQKGRETATKKIDAVTWKYCSQNIGKRCPLQCRHLLLASAPPKLSNIRGGRRMHSEINSLHVMPGEVLSKLKKMGVACHPTPAVAEPLAFIKQGTTSLRSVSSCREGRSGNSPSQSMRSGRSKWRNKCETLVRRSTTDGGTDGDVFESSSSKLSSLKARRILKSKTTHTNLSIPREYQKK